MIESSAASRRPLLGLVDELDLTVPEIADPVSRQRIETVLDSLAHVLVDIAENREHPTHRAPWPQRPRRSRARTAPPPGVDAATRRSASAAAARLNPVLEAISRVDGPLPQAALEAAETVRTALQRLAQSEQGTGSAELLSFDALLRRAHSALQSSPP